jgi:hypothetical protein
MVSDAMDEYYFLRESTAMLINLKRFVKAVKGVGFKEKYLQLPTYFSMTLLKLVDGMNLTSWPLDLTNVNFLYSSKNNNHSKI